MTERPLCRCHSVPMYPNNSNGGWRCRVKVRERQRPADRAYMTRAYGGWYRARLRALAAERADILERLAQLKQEAESLVPEP